MRPWTRHRLAAALAAAALAGGGCASLPPPGPRIESHALADPASSPLGRIVGAQARRAQDGEADRGAVPSGVRLLLDGGEAFDVLATLADRAERTLDLQYYLIENDASTRALLQRVRAAADRGVRVRLLLDDMHTAGQDAALLRLATHPRIALRLYNPFAGGRSSTVGRVLSSLTDLDRINRRMHNKMFVADNALAVTGGRNLGDAYFVHSPASNFVDLDLLLAGPVVQALSATFDRFWNSPLAYPVALVSDGREPNAPDTAADGHEPTPPQESVPLDSRDPIASSSGTFAQPSPLRRSLAQGRLPLRWVPAQVLADTPAKIEDGAQGVPHRSVADDIEWLLRSARREVILISPYLVPGERGMQLVHDLRARGVQVRILTNSLAATDAPVVHIGYARYRRELLEQGVELYELRPRLTRQRIRLGQFGSSQAKLHAKALVVDRHTLLVGSMNFDPRSLALNSEMGVLLGSPALAGRVVELFASVSADSSWRLALDDRGELRWHGRDADGAPLTLDSEPDASAWLRFALKLLSPLAPDELL